MTKREHKYTKYRPKGNPANPLPERRDIEDSTKKIKEMLKEERKKGRKEQNKVFGKIPMEKRLEIVAWVLSKLEEHLIEGGTYRTLIYKRMGFDGRAYGALYPMGMNLSNAFCDLNSPT